MAKLTYQSKDGVSELAFQSDNGVYEARFSYAFEPPNGAPYYSLEIRRVSDQSVVWKGGHDRVFSTPDLAFWEKSGRLMQKQFQLPDPSFWSSDGKTVLLYERAGWFLIKLE